MTDHGTVSASIKDHILHIEVDRRDKMNGFTPEMFTQLSEHMTKLDESQALWVGVVTFAGPHTTAGLDLPRFAASMRGEQERTPMPGVDAFGLSRKCRKPVVMAVQGITFTIGIEMMLGADIVVAADDCRFCQMEPKRGLAVFGGAHVRYVQRAGWGNAMYHLLRADEFDAGRAKEIGFVQEVVPAGQQITRALAAHLSSRGTPGAGEMWGLSGSVYGTALVWRGDVMHAAFFPDRVVRPLRGR